MDNDNTYDVVFPTLEQVFLKVTSDTAIHSHGGDGFVGDEETSTVIGEKIYALENREAIDINLEVAQTIGFVRQVQALFMKRYTLLQQKAGWISYGINLIIVIIITAALAKFHYDFEPLQTCQESRDRFRNPDGIHIKDNEYDVYYPVLRPTILTALYSYSGQAVALLAPPTAWSGSTQDELYKSVIGPLVVQGSSQIQGSYVDGQYQEGRLNDTEINDLISSSRQLFAGLDDIVTQITNYSGHSYSGFGIYSPTPETATLLYLSEGSIYSLKQYSEIFNLITNRISNSSTSAGTARDITASLRNMRSPSNKVNSLSLPISALIILAFICATSISVSCQNHLSYCQIEVNSLTQTHHNLIIYFRRQD
jgi:ATP-binding cassette subfamily A (ABC1) protein 3